MTAATWVALAYLAGLLLSPIAGSVLLLPILALALAIVRTLPATRRLRIARSLPRPGVLAIAALVAVLAMLYLHWRTPTPGPGDISEFAPVDRAAAGEELVMVRGRVEGSPSLTRSQKVRFWLRATQITEVVAGETDADEPLLSPGKPTSGRLYATVPLLQGTGLAPGEWVEVTGRLYRPKPPANPGEFDFQTYLARQGAFAGLAGRRAVLLDGEGGGNGGLGAGLWRLRQRIVRVQTEAMGVPLGPMVGAMVLGRRAVDLPFDLRDRFVAVGMAHVLAASGFHAAILLGLVRVATRRLSPMGQFALGTAVLALYVAIAGGSPSVARAAVMGSAALLGLALARRTRPLGVLLLAAVLLLLWNPLWIWDAGFQLSFLATLGLLVTVPPLEARLDWLPPAIAAAIAVPLAATLWTLPLQLRIFAQVSPYSLPINVLTGGLCALIVAWGFLCALTIPLLPAFGGVLALGLAYPAQLLLAIVTAASDLPGSTRATGTLSLAQTLALYGALVLVWAVPWWQRRQRWILVLLAAIALAAIPGWRSGIAGPQAWVLAAGNDPALAIRDGGETTLIYGGRPDAARFAVLPFLQRQGVNALATGVMAADRPETRKAWTLVLDAMPVAQFYALTADGEAGTGDRGLAAAVRVRGGNYEALPAGTSADPEGLALELPDAQPPRPTFRVGDRRWLLLDDASVGEQAALAQLADLPSVAVLWWNGGELSPALVERLRPTVAIASAETVDPRAAELLAEIDARLYWTGRDGAIAWSETSGFAPAIETAPETDILGTAPPLPDAIEPLLASRLPAPA